MQLATLAAKNVWRNKGRTIMTMIGVVIAVLAFMLLRTVLTSYDEAIEYGAKDRLATRNKISFVITLPKNYVEKVRAIPGVTAVTWANWFGAKDPKNESDFFATMATDPATLLTVYDDLRLDAAEKDAWTADRQGAIVGATLAKRKGWKVGDKVTLLGTIFPGEWSFNVRGIYTGTRKGTDLNQFFFHYDYLNESLDPGPRRDQIGWMVIKVQDEARGAEVGKAIDAMFEDSDKATLTQSELALNRSFMAMFDAILKAINIVSIVILGIMMLILGNTLAMGVRERTKEYGTLRAIGFLPRHVAMFILGEAAVTGLIGGAVGVLLATGFINNGVGRFLEENMAGFFPSFKVATTTTVAAFLLAIGLGVAAAAVPAWRASKLKVVDALRQVG